MTLIFHWWRGSRPETSGIVSLKAPKWNLSLGSYVIICGAKRFLTLQLSITSCWFMFARPGHKLDLKLLVQGRVMILLVASCCGHRSLWPQCDLIFENLFFIQQNWWWRIHAPRTRASTTARVLMTQTVLGWISSYSTLWTSGASAPLDSVA